jgi:thiol-disulfide isomerase/thioredoxin
MFSRVLPLAFGALILFSCGEENSPLPPPQAQNETYTPLKGEEKDFLKKVLSSVFPPSWEILDIYLVTPSEDKDLKKYLVRFYSPMDHAVYSRYLWFSPEGELLFTYAYKVQGERAYPLIPPKGKEYPLENISWVLDFERVAFSANLPVTLTVGNKGTIYLVWNPYCKVCYQKWQEILKDAKEKGLTVKLIPYHNVYYPLDNLYMLIYILYSAQKEGLPAVLERYYSQSKDFNEFLERLKKDTYANLGRIPKEEYNSIGFALKQIYQVLAQAKIFTVPTTVKLVEINDRLGLAKGYVYVGEIRIEPSP